MPTEQDAQVSEAILELFRELGLEDEQVRNHFQRLGETSDWYAWEEDYYENQDTKGDTAKDGNDNNA